MDKMVVKEMIKSTSEPDFRTKPYSFPSYGQYYSLPLKNTITAGLSNRYATSPLFRHNRFLWFRG